MTFDTVLADYLAAQTEVIAAYLFGSQAKGTARAGSDVDVALLLDPAFDLESHFAYRLEQTVALELACRRSVDVIILNQTSLVLRNQVLKYGRLIYERDHRQRVAFEVQSRFAYYDFKPVLDLLHSTLLRQIQEVGLAGRYRGRYNALDDARRARERFERP